jgi:hypothetical protein
VDKANRKIESVERLIHEVRGRKVMIDADLARLYGVGTKVLNQAVKRNQERFPADFMFQLIRTEVEELNRSQFVTGSQKHRDPRFSPFAFTEHGAIMAANVLNSPRAIRMSVFVVRAFVKMRSVLTDTRETTRKLALLEKELKGRLNVHESAIVTILQRVMDIIDPPALPDPPRRKIGFKMDESASGRPRGRGGR